MRWTLCSAILAVAACDADGNAGQADATVAVEARCDRPRVFEKSPDDALEGSGWHRLYIQGGGASPDADGRFGMTEHRNQVVNGDHFLLGRGGIVEFVYPVRAALTGHVFAHIARVDDADVTARYELYFVRGGERRLLFVADDAETGEMGYTPFERCAYGWPGDATTFDSDDHLLLRATNLTGGMLGVVTRAPDYFTWIDVEVQ